MIVPELLYNVTLLVALCVLSGFIEERVSSDFLSGKLLQGLLFGLIAVISMIVPYPYMEGVIFDGRTIVISVGTLFFGPISGLISIILASVYRFTLGGDGMIVGILIIFGAYFSGWLYRLLFFRHKKSETDIQYRLNKKDFYILGLIVHLLMIAILFVLPGRLFWDILDDLFFSIIIIYPLITILIGKILQDQQKQKRHLKLISESEAKFRLLVASTDDIIFTMNHQMKHTGVYGKWVRDTGKRPEDFLGKSATEILGEDIGVFHETQYKKALEGETVVYEWVTDVNGIGNTYQTKLSPIRNDYLEIIGLVGVGRNITAIKHTQKELAHSLKEKQILLSEIHHRVKNNMAIISSLLSLQSDYFSDIKSKKIFLDTESKVRSMALLHEIVYEQYDFAEIETSELLQRLLRLLSESYDFDEKNISMELEAEPILLDMNDSIPFTLLLSELITNSFKHAFTGKERGKLSVLFKLQNDRYELTVKDDGKGVSHIQKLENPDSFGYTIVHGLVRQLQGDIHFDNTGEGLKVVVTFPAKRKNSSTLNELN